jgi:hypothetical protein
MHVASTKVYIYEERIDQQEASRDKKENHWRIRIKKLMEEEASHLQNRMLVCLFACFLSLILVLHHTCTRNSLAPTTESEEITEEKPERKRRKNCAKENRCTRPQE